MERSLLPCERKRDRSRTAPADWPTPPACDAMSSSAPTAQRHEPTARTLADFDAAQFKVMYDDAGGDVAAVRNWLVMTGRLTNAPTVGLDIRAWKENR